MGTRKRIIYRKNKRSRKKSRKHGKLKRSVKTKSGRRMCKKKPKSKKKKSHKRKSKKSKKRKSKKKKSRKRKSKKNSKRKRKNKSMTSRRRRGKYKMDGMAQNWGEDESGNLVDYNMVTFGDSDDEDWDDVNMSDPPQPRGATLDMSEYNPPPRPRTNWISASPDPDFMDAVAEYEDAYETDGYESGEDMDRSPLEVLSPKVVSSRCARDCVGKDDIITLEQIQVGDNAVKLDKQCYNPSSLREALRHNPKLPHNRSRFTMEDLNRILMKDNDNECL
jgi:hypothetical protein